MLNLPAGPIQDTLTIFWSIVIEATPFIVLGVSVSLIIRAFVTEDLILRFKPRNPFLSHALYSTLGVVFPVCECGNVPLIRQLISKNIPISNAISFYLSAPILNIAVITTTGIAFGFDSNLFWSRMIFGFLIAYIVGLYFNFTSGNNEENLTKEMKIMCSHNNKSEKGFGYLKSKKAAEYFMGEMRSMFVLLVFGALVASITQIWIPRDFLLNLNSSPFIALSSMIFLAVIISVCSTVDAFIALGLRQVFSDGAILGFLLYGPMIDIKALSMLSTTFKLKFILKLVGLVTILTYIFALLFIIIGN